MVFYVKRRGESVDEGRGFTIIDYEDRYKQALEDISLPWLLEYDLLELSLIHI